MNCLYCGKGFRLASKIIHDPDFCSPAHRWKFRKRLETAVKLIHRSAEMHATGLAGFQYEPQGPQVVDFVHSSDARAVRTRTRAIALGGMRLNVTAEALLVDQACLPDEVSAHQPLSPANREKGLRVSELVAGLRADIEKRRRDGANSRPRRGPAPLIEFQSIAASA